MASAKSSGTAFTRPLNEMEKKVLKAVRDTDGNLAAATKRLQEQYVYIPDSMIQDAIEYCGYEKKLPGNGKLRITFCCPVCGSNTSLEPGDTPKEGHLFRCNNGFCQADLIVGTCGVQLHHITEDLEEFLEFRRNFLESLNVLACLIQDMKYDYKPSQAERKRLEEISQKIDEFFQKR